MVVTNEMIEAFMRANTEAKLFSGRSPYEAARIALTAALAVAPAVEVKPLETHVDGWTKVPEELSLELLRSINRDNQVLAYENGRYYNAWFEFEPSEGGWFWTDEADSEPNPSHYRPLREVALATTETNGHE
jgi:hypothetical protein